MQKNLKISEDVHRRLKLKSALLGCNVSTLAESLLGVALDLKVNVDGGAVKVERKWPSATPKRRKEDQ